jgi:hypothetical protein
MSCRREDVARRRGSPRGALPTGSHSTRTTTMQDLVMLAIAAGFFALSVGYAYACERL